MSSTSQPDWSRFAALREEARRAFAQDAGYLTAIAEQATRMVRLQEDRQARRKETTSKDVNEPSFG